MINRLSIDQSKAMSELDRYNRWKELSRLLDDWITQKAKEKTWLIHVREIMYRSDWSFMVKWVDEWWNVRYESFDI